MSTVKCMTTIRFAQFVTENKVYRVFEDGSVEGAFEDSYVKVNPKDPNRVVICPDYTKIKKTGMSLINDPILPERRFAQFVIEQNAFRVFEDGSVEKMVLEEGFSPRFCPIQDQEIQSIGLKCLRGETV